MQIADEFQLANAPPAHAAGVKSSATMAVAVGAKLGPYEILAPIGAGGMGEVYPIISAKIREALFLGRQFGSPKPFVGKSASDHSIEVTPFGCGLQ
jgi:hypothetical protein